MVDRLPIHEAANRADSVIDVSRENIPAAQKAAIAKEENKIRTALVNFKSYPDYKDIIQYFKDDPENDGYEPDAYLDLLTRRFVDMQKETSQQAYQKLEWLGRDTLTQLQDLKRRVGEAAAENERLNLAAQSMYERSLPSYDSNPSHVTESLTSIGESIGMRPNIEKLSAVELEYNKLLLHLRKRENLSMYLQANANFKGLSGGKGLESVKPEIDRALAKVASIAGANPEGAKRALMTRYSAAIDSMSIAIKTMSRALIPEEKPSPEESLEAQVLSPEEIQFVLNVLLHGSQNPSFLEQLFDAENAYQYTTGRTYEQMNAAEKFLVVGVGQGVGNTASFMGSLMLDTRATLTGLAEGMEGLFNPETRQRLWAVLKEGVWETMPPLEKSLLITQMLTDIIAGGALEGGVGALLQKAASSGRMATITTRLSSVARKSGFVENAAKLSLSVSTVLQKFPSLARFGSSTKEMVKGMALEAKIVSARLKVVAGKYEGPVRDIIETESNFASPSATAVTTRSDVSKYIPAYADKVALEADLKTAYANASTLGVSPQELVVIRSALQTLASS